MSIHEYFADIAEELNRKSDSIRKHFASHHPSAGRNREKLVADFLRAYLPKAYGIDTGLILAPTGKFSVVSSGLRHVLVYYRVGLIAD